jgi:hypothetical protein
LTFHASPVTALVNGGDQIHAKNVNKRQALKPLILTMYHTIYLQVCHKALLAMSIMFESIY